MATNYFHVLPLLTEAVARGIPGRLTTFPVQQNYRNICKHALTINGRVVMSL